MINQVAWSLLAVSVYIVIAIVATRLGLRASVYLTNKYENWQRRRNSYMKNQPEKFPKYGVINHAQKRDIYSVSDSLKCNKENSGYQEPDKQTHESSITGR